MSLSFYKMIAGLFIFLTSLVAIIYPLKIRAHPTHHTPLELGDAFASGIFLGAALFHLLPDATRDFIAVFGAIHYPLAELFAAGGFLLLLFFERLSRQAPSQHIHNLPYVLAFIIIIHSFIEGTALGINTALSTTAIIFIAITAHKSSESFALAVILNRSQLPLKQLFILIGLFSIMTPLGIALGTRMITLLHTRNALILSAVLNAIAAGTFLYMSTLHHINHHQREHTREGMVEFGFLVIGLVVMALLAWWA